MLRQTWRRQLFAPRQYAPPAAIKEIMVEYFNTLALRLNKFSPLIWAAFFASLLLLAFILFSKQRIYHSDMQILFVVMPIWLLGIIAFIRQFRIIIEKPDKDLNWLRRMIISLKRLLQYLLACLFSAVFLSIYYLLYKALALSF